MPVEDPGGFLAFFAAILRPPASSAFCELAGELLPFPALVICTLSNAPTGIILAAQISHYNASPVLHVLTVMADCELFHKGEDVEVVWEEVFFFFGIAGGYV